MQLIAFILTNSLTRFSRYILGRRYLVSLTQSKLMDGFETTLRAIARAAPGVA